VPPPTKTGAVASMYSSISPARIAAAASGAPPTSMGPPSSEGEPPTVPDSLILRRLASVGCGAQCPVEAPSPGAMLVNLLRGNPRHRSPRRHAKQRAALFCKLYA